MMDREETRLRRSPFMMRDESLKAYLKSVMNRLAGDHGPDIRVFPVRTPMFNASMAPNGMLQVWSGLLLRIDNEAQLASVLGHELGHYLNRHVLEQLKDARSRSAFAMVMGAFGLIGALAQMAALSGSFAFSRDQEREADMIGLHLMRRAGYDTREAAKVWQNLNNEFASSAKSSSQAGVMFATHPASTERAATLARLAAASEEGFVGEAEFHKVIDPWLASLLEDELKRGQYGESVVLLDRLIKRSPQRADLAYYRGEALRLRDAAGDVESAVAQLESAIALGQEPPQTHRSLGYLYRKTDREEQSRQAFARYLERAPGAPDAPLIKTYLQETQ